MCRCDQHAVILTAAPVFIKCQTDCNLFIFDIVVGNFLHMYIRDSSVSVE